MTNDDSNPRSRQIDIAIAEYLEAIERGSPPNQHSFLSQHADIAKELREFLADYSALKQEAPRPGSGGDETTDLSKVRAQRASHADGAVLSVLRYFGDYELVEEIARGGMGVVYKARQTSLNRTVAVKMILAGQLASQIEVDRFYAEAQAAATLDHPNIVPIFEVGQHQGQHYFSMGYVAGQSLAQRLAAGPLVPKEAATIIRKVALAVHYAHVKGVIHRDLKPANILFDADGHPRVTDFGLAKRQTDASGLTATGQVLGTPSYMPPEQVSGSNGQIGPAADVYSLGATLYALLTGRPPFQSASVVDTLKQVLEKDPVPLREFDASVPRDLETITLKCLEKSSERRYASAQSLADELDRYLTGRPILARPVSRAEHAWRWCRRNPMVAGLTAAVAISMIVGTIASSFFAIQSNYRANENLALAKKEGIARADSQKQQMLAEANAKLAAQRQREAENNADTARRRLYAANMNLCKTAWEESHIGVLRALLESTTPKSGEEDLRGFEWYYWNRLCHRDLATFRVPGYVSAFSPDGTRLASAADGSISIWDVATGQQIQTFKGIKWVVQAIAFSPDGKVLATDSLANPIKQIVQNDTIKLWDVSTGQETAMLTGHQEAVTCVGFSPDGRYLVSGSKDRTIKQWDVATGQETRTSKAHYSVRSVAYSPDGKYVVSIGEDATIKLWNADTGEEAMSLTGDSAAFNRDGTQLFSGSLDGTIKLWDLATRNLISTLTGQGHRVRTFAFSPDGKRLATASGDSTLTLWDLAAGKEQTTLKGHVSTVESITFSPDGKRLASWSGSELKLWDSAVGPENATLEGARSIAVSPDGSRVAAANYGNLIKVWDLATLQEYATLADDASILAFSPDGLTLVSAGSPFIKIWDMATRRQTKEWQEIGQLFSCVTYSPDGTQLAAASNSQTIKLWNVATGRNILTLQDHAEWLAFSPDGKQLASCGRDDSVRFWDTATGVKLKTLKGGRAGIMSIVFTPDGKYLSSSNADGTITMWDLAKSQKSITFSGHAHDVRSIAFSPDGRRLASASMDQTVKLWDVISGQETLTLKSYTDWGTRVAFSPDGRRLVSGGLGKTKLWDTYTPSRRDEFEESLAFYTKLTNEDPDEPRYQRTLADCHNNFGMWLKGEKDLAAARAHFDQSLAIRTKLTGDFPDVPDYVTDLGGSCCNIGLLVREDDPEASLAWFDRAQQAIESALTETSQDFKAKRYLLMTHRERADALTKLGRNEEAATERSAAAKLDGELQILGIAGDRDFGRPAVENSAVQRDATKRKRFTQLEQSLDECMRLAAEDSDNLQYRRNLAHAHYELAILLLAADDGAGARFHCDHADTILTKLYFEFPDVPEYTTLLGGVECKIAMIANRDDPKQALYRFDGAKDWLERAIAKTPHDRMAISFLREVYAGWASALEKLGQTDEATKIRQKAVELQSEIESSEPNVSKDVN